MSAFLIQNFLFFVLFIFLGYSLGNNILKKIFLSRGVEFYTLSIATGWGIFGFLIMAIGFLGLLYPLAVFIISFLIILAGLINGMGDFRSLLNGLIARKQVVFLIAVILLLAYLLILFWLALFPVTEWDALSYHLPIAKEFISNKRIILTPFLRFPVSPQMIELFFAFSLMFGSAIFASLSQYAMSLVLCFLIYSFCFRYITKERSTCLLSSAIFITSPLVSQMSVVPYVEAGSALFCFSAFYLMCLSIDENKRILSIVSGILWATAMGSKYYSIPVFIFSMLILTALFRGNISKLRLSLIIVIALLAAFPWYLRNRYYSGDWFFPVFLNKVINKGLWSLEDFQRQRDYVHGFGLGRGFREFITLPINLLRYSDKFNTGNIGGFLIAPACLFILFVKKWTKYVILIAAIIFLYIILWFSGFQVARYLFPILPFTAILSAWVIERFCLFFHKQCIYLAVILVILTVFFNIIKVAKDKGRLPLGPSEQSAYLGSRLSTYNGIDFLNKTTDHSSIVYNFYDEGSTFYYENKVIGDAFGPAGYYNIWRFLDNYGLWGIFEKYNVKYLLINKSRLQEGYNYMLDKLLPYGFKTIYEDENCVVYDTSK
jgi:hypothetical protein